jgi:hypothetical protein
MFGIPGLQDSEAWQQFRDPAGFWAPLGLTTAERRHPAFRTHGTGKCEWDGAVWPFATSQTLSALAKALRAPENKMPLAKKDYFDALLTYSRSHQMDGKPYIGEYLDETDGRWLITGPKAERSRYYNHSTFADLVIHDLVGIQPEKLSIACRPLIPEDAWDWFCLDGVPWHGHRVAVAWDRTGAHYDRGTGLSLWIDGQLAGHSDSLRGIDSASPPTAEAK